jgi:hypothetical protein
MPPKRSPAPTLPAVDGIAPKQPALDEAPPPALPAPDVARGVTVCALALMLPAGPYITTTAPAEI